MAGLVPAISPVMAGLVPAVSPVMTGLVPAIHVFFTAHLHNPDAWVAGSTS
jgi:hypothetical protein